MAGVKGRSGRPSKAERTHCRALITQAVTDEDWKNIFHELADPTWQSLLATPNHPEYPSAHGCLTAAEAQVFVTFLGTNQINLDITSTVPNLLHSTRHFAHAQDLVREIVNARIWGGLHYRQSMVQGVNVGRQVAYWTLKRYFLLER